MDIEVFQAEIAEPAGSQRQSAEPGTHGAFRRRLLGIGLGGAAAALVPTLIGRASASTPPNTGAPSGTADGSADTAGATTGGSATASTEAATTTTAPPKRPADADLPLLNFAQGAELAVNELYKLALAGTLDDDQRTVLEVIGQSHLAYGQALSGLLGRIADNAPDEDVVTAGTAAFKGGGTAMLQAAYQLESTLVATHTAIVGQILGTDAAYLLASIVTIEARNGTVLASLGGATELTDLLVDNEADALTPAGDDVVTHHHNEAEPATTGGIDRRMFLRLGGGGVALATILSACTLGNNTEAGKLGRVGLAPSTTKLPTVGTTDVALLRTCSSLQHSLLEVYNKIKDDATLLDPAHKPLVTKLIADAEAAATVFDGLTTGLGGVPWTCGNSKFDSVLINPAIQRITTATPATPEAKAIPASDDMKRDMLTLTHGMESIIAATYQQYVTLLSKPATRAPVLKVGAANARHAALLALTINTARPDGYVSSDDQDAAQVPIDTTPGATPTTVQDIGQSTTTAAASGGNAPTAIIPPSAIPGTFGATATLQIVVGAGDENGTRLKLNLETPSVNSFEYEYLTPSC